MPKNISSILEKFKSSKILVVGDLILDRYTFGKVTRISPEAPIQIFDIEREELRLGGAANVAKNLVALKSNVSILGVVGQDENGKKLQSILETNNINVDHVLECPDRPTTIKTRFIAKGNHLLRADKETQKSISKTYVNDFIDSLKKKIQNYDCIVISDYAKGVMTTHFCQNIIKLAKKENKKIMVGPKGKNWNRYINATLLSGNIKETELVTHSTLRNKEDIKEAGKKLIEKLKLDAMLITMGSRGLYLIRKRQDFYLEAQSKEVFDVVGAGDTVLSVISMCLNAKCSWRMSLTLANKAAGIVVGKVGTSPVTPQELENSLT